MYGLEKSSNECVTLTKLDLYKHLTKEDDHDNVHGFLQDLMEQDVLKCGMIEELALDVGQTRRKFRDPICTMEARHQQVNVPKLRLACLGGMCRVE